ncbi:MAG: methylmalonyl Co-A mutase-associated GTPase MeaB [Actinomycetota bacterium]|nr:methylmalonyl Co-A mutase-associated GTPase MeaB [Actinomycetota bacterium]
MNAGEVADGVLAGERRAVARAISMVERGAPELPELIAALHPHTGRAWVVGLTGSPGVGKSSLAAQLVKAARSRDRKVAVLAIDPTSPFTGGALLGDRLRMQAHATDPGVFIRSMATRGHLGGLALAAPEALRVLDASGAEVVLLETVGVGQAEVEVASTADTTVVVVAPGWGDAVQASKAGILEIADVFVVNKADREGAGEAARDLELMLKMGPRQEWTPPVVRTSTVTDAGIDDLWDAIERHRKHQEATGALARIRRDRVVREVEEMVAARLRRRVAGLLRAEGAMASLADDLAEGRVDPYRAADMLVERVEDREATR